jgi:hypothetical protein
LSGGDLFGVCRANCAASQRARDRCCRDKLWKGFRIHENSVSQRLLNRLYRRRWCGVGWEILGEQPDILLELSGSSSMMASAFIFHALPNRADLHI